MGIVVASIAVAVAIKVGIAGVIYKIHKNSKNELSHKNANKIEENGKKIEQEKKIYAGMP